LVATKVAEKAVSKVVKTVASKAVMMVDCLVGSMAVYWVALKVVWRVAC